LAQRKKITANRQQTSSHLYRLIENTQENDIEPINDGVKTSSDVSRTIFARTRPRLEDGNIKQQQQQQQTQLRH